MCINLLQFQSLKTNKTKKTKSYDNNNKKFKKSKNTQTNKKCICMKNEDDVIPNYKCVEN